MKPFFLSMFRKENLTVRRDLTLELPKAWTPMAPMKRIHVHWTAGSYLASALDREHYHFLVEGDCAIIKGQMSVAANVPPLREGEYAAHTYRANSHAIGIGICAMHNASQSPLRAGGYPITREQWDQTIHLVAYLARRYGINVTPQTVLTHAELQGNLGIKQRGKWDVQYLPFMKKLMSPREVGDLLRAGVLEYG